MGKPSLEEFRRWLQTEIKEIEEIEEGVDKAKRLLQLEMALQEAMAFDAAWEFSQGKTTGKIILAKDMNYMTEAFLTVPGDSFAIYPKNITDYEVILDKSGFKVKERNDSTDEGFVSTFILPEGYDAVGLANCRCKKD